MEIKTKRLLLRPFTIDDLNDVYSYTSQTAVAHAAGFTPVSDVRGALLFLEVLQNQGALAIYSYLLRKVVGNISFYPNFDSRQVEIGYALSKDVWNRGYMTEALKALCPYLSSKDVSAYVRMDNPASVKVLLKCGFEQQNIFKEGAQLFKLAPAKF